MTLEILPLVENPKLASQTHWKLTKFCARLCAENQLDQSYMSLAR